VSKSDDALMKGALTLLLAPPVIGGVVLALVPLQLAVAWIRSQVWAWFFVPYFHAPQIGVWLMFAVGSFIGLFRSSPRSLKDEHYKHSYAFELFSQIVAEICIFGVLYGVHLWVLKG